MPFCELNHKRLYLSWMKHLISILLLSAFSLGCQTLPQTDFAKVQPGMDKHSVLEIMGSPNSTLRRSGQDRWYYNYYEQNSPVTKEVRFQEGLAVYSGDLMKPALSAEDEDKRNEESNQALVADYERSQNERDAQNNPPEQTEEQSVKYLPSFEPVQ